MGVVRAIRYKGLHVRSGGKERLIATAVRDGISERIGVNNLGHCKGGGDALERGALCLIYSKVLCLRRGGARNINPRQGGRWTRNGTGSGDG